MFYTHPKWLAGFLPSTVCLSPCWFRGQSPTYKIRMNNEADWESNLAPITWSPTGGSRESMQIILWRFTGCRWFEPETSYILCPGVFCHPISAFAEITAVKENQVVLLSGETGCGKSTQAPVGRRFGEGCLSGMMRWFKRFHPRTLTVMTRSYRLTQAGSTCCWDSD